jgi:hypothetical protein
MNCGARPAVVGRPDKLAVESDVVRHGGRRLEIVSTQKVALSVPA